MNISDEITEGHAIQLAFHKIEQCVVSAKTPEHVQTCAKMISALNTLYGQNSTGYVKELKRFLNTRADQLGVPTHYIRYD